MNLKMILIGSNVVNKTCLWVCVSVEALIQTQYAAVTADWRASGTPTNTAALTMLMPSW